jgi:ligand-binding sensor domain-containing protein/signal transduction histidine kinase
MKHRRWRREWIAGIIWLLFPAGFALAQSPHLQFKHLTPDEGLSSSTVTSILQDHKGYMWIGTYNGLDRYDGINFVPYRSNSRDSTSLPHNLIWQLLEDRSHQLWAATGHGLCRFDWITESFVDYMVVKDSPLRGLDCGVQSICEDSLGNIWLGTTIGLVYFDRIKNQAVHYQHDPQRPASLSNDQIENLFQDSKKRLWISTRNGLNLLLRDQGTFKRFKYDSTSSPTSSRVHFMDMVEDRDGNLWIGTLGHGLYFLPANHPETGKMINYRHDPYQAGSLSGDRILSLYIDSQGRLWVGTENAGLNLWDAQRKIFEYYQKDVYNPSGLNNNSVYAIYEDQTANLWIGTFAGGINISKFNGAAILQFQNLPAAPEGLTHNSVTSFLEDHLGRIWIGTDGGGINLFKENTGRFRGYHTANSSLNSDAVLSLVEDAQQRIWVGTWGGGLNRFDPQTGAFHAFTTHNSELPEDNILLVVEDKKGHLWLGSFQSGLIGFDPTSHRIISYTTRNSRLSYDMIVDIETAADGCLYVGTFYGFNIFNPDSREFIPYFHNPEDPNSLSNDVVHDIMVENDTTVWVATLDGLNRFNPQRRTFQRYYQHDGLPDNLVKGCILDDSGHLWISTNKGLGHFDPLSKKSKNFTRADGLQSNEFNFRSLLRTRNGRLFFGGRKGFNVIYPENLVENKNVPRLLITDFSIFNKPVRCGTPDSPLRKHISETDRITLAYDQSFITFGFAVVDFTMPEKNQYAYRMEGFEKEWNQVGTQRSATYTNLEPGQYTFRVKGSNNDGFWNEEGASIRIVITPPFWGTPWFRFASMICIAGLLLLGHYLRTTRIRKYNQELEERIRERTSELEIINKELESFSYSVSHDLRAPLRSMNGFSEILLESFGKKLDPEGRGYLQRIREASTRMGNLIDDLLKLSRLSRTEMIMTQVNLSTLAESIMKDLQRNDPVRQVELYCTAGLFGRGVESLLKVLLWNLIDNAWKFTSKKPVARIEFGAMQGKGGMVYFIKDDGIGFDNAFKDKIFEIFYRYHTEFAGTGLGLGTAKRIIIKHNGSIWAEGKVNEGATFFFTLGWKHQDKR